MAEEPEQVKKGTGQNVLLYKVWLRNQWERLIRTFGPRIAVVLVAVAAAFILAFFLILVGGAIGLVAGLTWYLSPVFNADNKLSIVDRKDLVQGFASVAQALAVALAGVAGLIGLVFTWRSLRQTRESTQATLELTEQGQNTERFTHAVDQIGADKLDVRLGGIYALGRIADEGSKYRWPIIEVLTAFVRERAPFQRERKPEGRADMQAVLNVIADLTLRYGASEGERNISLGGADLFSLELTKINLEGAQLDGAHLEAAVVQANLKKARLVGTHLESAIVINSELEEANLSGAHLEGTSFLDVKLAGANFAGAHVRRTSFDRTDLSEVTNFSQEMLEQANGDWSTTPPKECQAPEWWSTLPGYNGPLRPGSYGVKLCARALFFDVDEGWYSRLSLPNSVFITPTGITHLGSMLSLHNIQWVRDPNKPTEEHEILRTPPDLAAWLLEHPALEVESQEEAQIGNASGVQFDAIIPRGQGIDVGAHRPGFPMFPLSRAAHFTLLEGNKNRFIVLNVGDETMTIIVESPAKEFDKFFARTNELLATVKWQDLP